MQMFICFLFLQTLSVSSTPVSIHMDTKDILRHSSSAEYKINISARTKNNSKPEWIDLFNKWVGLDSEVTTS